MKTYRLKNTIRGWFVGDFPKAVYRTKHFEVAVKIEKAGEHVERHVHRVATEITAVAEGCVCINNKKFKKGDIIVIGPNEDADYKVLKDAVTVIVKIPSIKNDKYLTRSSR